MEVKPGRRLVENKQQRLRAILFEQERRQFHPLALAPRQSGRRLPQLDIPQPDIL